MHQHTSYQAPNNIQCHCERFLKGHAFGTPVLWMYHVVEVAFHKLRNHEYVRRSHAATIHPHDVGVVQSCHDLELRLQGTLYFLSLCQLAHPTLPAEWPLTYIDL